MMSCAKLHDVQVTSVVQPKSIFLAFGFFLGMIVMEVVLEYVTSKYKDVLSRSALPTAVTLSQFLFCFLLPIIVRPSIINSISFRPIKLFPYAALSLVVFCASGLATAAVSYVSYPMKIVFKSIKLVPTMIVSNIMLGNVHSVGDYAAATLLCVGTALFVYDADPSSPSETEGVPRSSSWVGVTMLIFSVLCDALLPNLQKRMLLAPAARGTFNHSPKASSGDAPHPSQHQISPEELMVNTNLVGGVVLLLYMVLGPDAIMSELVSVIAFHQVPTAAATVESMTLVVEAPLDPEAVAAMKEVAVGEFSSVLLLSSLCLVGLCLAASVLCYTNLIKEAGPVAAVSVATLRKVITMILSYVLFPKAVDFKELLALGFIVGGIALESFNAASKASRKG